MSGMKDPEKAARKAERKAARRAAAAEVSAPATSEEAPARPLDPRVAEAARSVAEARSALGEALDGAVDTGKIAIDPREWFRRDPLRTAALAGGAGFLAVGGPKRVLRAAGRLIPRRRPSGAGLLPDEIERVLRDHALARDPKIRRAIEQDFADYLRARGKVRPAASATISFWRTYDVLVGPIGRQAAKSLVERLFSATEEGPR